MKKIGVLIIAIIVVFLIYKYPQITTNNSLESNLNGLAIKNQQDNTDSLVNDFMTKKNSLKIMNMFGIL